MPAEDRRYDQDGDPAKARLFGLPYLPAPVSSLLPTSFKTQTGGRALAICVFWGSPPAENWAPAVANQGFSACK